MITDIQKRYNDSIEFDKARKAYKAKARNEYSHRFFTYVSASLICVVYFFFSLAVSYFISFASLSTAMVYAFFACFPAFKGMILFCENTVTSGKRDFGLIFWFLYSPRHFAISFGEALKGAVTLIWALFPFFVTSFVPPKYAITEKYALLFEIISAFLLFYGVFYWLAYTFFGKTDRECVSFAFSFLLHIIIVFLTDGLWLLPFLPYFSLSLIYSKNKK